jgi:hypothetical protein
MRRWLAIGLVVLVAGLVPASAAAGRTRQIDPVRGPTRAAAWVARVVVRTPAYARPQQSQVVTWLGARARWAGGPTQLLVLGAQQDPGGRRWLRVRLPERPNGAAGWILADRAVLSRTSWRLELDLSARRVQALHRGRVVRSFRAVIGAAATPTPRGHFAIAEIVRQPDPGGFLGPWALLLTAHSDVLDDFGGGPGTVAIHGRAGASLLDPLGSARSHGCIRIDNRQVGFLARVLVPGAPVTIRG